MPSRRPSRRESNPEVDVDRLREVFDQHPVQLAVLFGSAARGTSHPTSDIDLAVEFDDAIEDEKQALLSLLTDLSIELDRNDVDVALVSDMKPAVGLAAFSDGVLVIGSRERMETHRGRFEREVERLDADRPSLRERFDAVIEGVDRALKSP